MTDSKRQYPLPPVPRKSDAPKKATRSLAARGAKAVMGTPGKLVARVNQELYKRNAELAVRNKTLALLRKLDEISLSAIGLAEMAQQMADAIAVELGYELVSLAMVEEKTQQLQWLAMASAVPALTAALRPLDLKQLNAPLTSELVSIRALRENEPVLAESLAAVFPASFVETVTAAHLEEHPVEHSLLYPLRFGSQTLGVFTVSSARAFTAASRYERESLSGIVGLLALALYKADLYEDLQEATAQLESANKQLTELDKSKSEFLSIASHQLYTPLTALRGYVSMLQEGDFGEVPKMQQPVLDILNTSVDRLIALIKNLLDISRIESGRLELNLQSVDLVKMVDEMVQQLYPNAVAKQLKLSFHHPPKALPHVVADEQRLRQVMLNFIDNAIKYTQKGHIEVSLKPEDNEIIFAVTDTGKGLKEDEVSQLFHKFTRVGGASRFHTEGTGLGLYVAKQIVQEHHGEVVVSSPGVGKGSTFSVRLPIEGSAQSLQIGEKASVVIKAADANGTAA